MRVSFDDALKYCHVITIYSYVMFVPNNIIL